MAGFVPAIHALLADLPQEICRKKDVDARDKRDKPGITNQERHEFARVTTLDTKAFAFSRDSVYSWRQRNLETHLNQAE
jgi:hypothetical protein